MGINNRNMSDSPIKIRGIMRYSGIPPIADAILDRLVHNAYRIELTGESLRKMKNPPLTNTPT